jgi:hypothetical protein
MSASTASRSSGQGSSSPTSCCSSRCSRATDPRADGGVGSADRAAGGHPEPSVSQRTASRMRTASRARTSRSTDLTPESFAKAVATDARRKVRTARTRTRAVIANSVVAFGGCLTPSIPRAKRAQVHGGDESAPSTSNIRRGGVGLTRPRLSKGSSTSTCGRCAEPKRAFGLIGMEQLWNRGGATGRNVRAAQGAKWLELATNRCHWLPPVAVSIAW